MPDEIEGSYAAGRGRLLSSVARWMPAGIVDAEVGDCFAPEADASQSQLSLSTVRFRGTFGETAQVLAVAAGRDPRPLCDEVPLVKIDGGIFGGRCCDLLSWCFTDTGRVVTLPMEPVVRFMLANQGNLGFMGRYETGVVVHLARYVKWERFWFTLLELREGLKPYLRWRGHIEAPEGVAFCRLPGCDQMARYPGPPKKSVWCWRHYEMSRGNLPMAHATDRGNRARSKKEPGFPRADVPEEEDLMREAEDPDFEMTVW